MTITPSVVGLVLIAALLHAIWNTLVKTGADGLLMFTLIKVPTMVVGLVVLVVVGTPERASIPYAIASSVGFTAYCFLLVWAYRLGDFNLVYPVARGSAPLAVALLSAAFIGEHLDTVTLAGVVVISLGILLFTRHAGGGPGQLPDLLRAVGVGVCIASYTLLDGAGARESGNALAYSALVTVLSGIPLIVTTSLLRGRDLARSLRRDWKIGLVGGVLMFTTYAVVIYAMTLAPITHVAALRETSIIFAALIGATILKEPLGLRRTLAAAVVVSGIIVVALSG